jgi:hypothetical protein
MKHVYFFLLCLFSLIITKASAQDYVLLPEKFILHKGDSLKLHLITANQFNKQNELRYEGSKTAKFMLMAGSKKTDLLTMAKDSASPIITIPAGNEGLNMISMVRKSI